MRDAFAAAMERGFNYYLWLNDDTQHYPTSIEWLVTTAHDLQAKSGKSVVVVGSAEDANDGRLTYVEINRWQISDVAARMSY